MRYAIFSLIMLTAIACREKKEDGIIMSKEAMVHHLIDLHIAEAEVQNLRLKKDSTQKIFKIYEHYLLEKNGLTDSLFIRSYNYYMEHPKELEEIYESVVDSISVKSSVDEVQK